jgi:predicted alpha/beta superfamily hydrolase
MKTGRLTALLWAAFVLGALCQAGFGQGNKIIIGETIKLKSAILDEERTLQISLPDEYQNSREKYPVIYLLDGESQFAHTVGAVRFLGKVNQMPQAIIVGIPNTNRNRDLSPPTSKAQDLKTLPGGGGAGKFLSFLIDELRPSINRDYRTQPYNILFGHSGAGLFVIHTFLNRPDAFSTYIASSPALWWNDNQEARSAEKILTSERKVRSVLFISYADEVELMTKSIEPFVRLLHARPTPGLRWKFEHLTGENHESAPHQALYHALRFLYQDWRFDFAYLYDEFNPEKKVFTADVLLRHYDRLTNEFGYNCRPAEAYYNSVGYDLLSQNRSLRPSSSSKPTSFSIPNRRTPMTAWPKPI